MGTWKNNGLRAAAVASAFYVGRRWLPAGRFEPDSTIVLLIFATGRMLSVLCGLGLWKVDPRVLMFRISHDARVEAWPATYCDQ